MWLDRTYTGPQLSSNCNEFPDCILILSPLDFAVQPGSFEQVKLAHSPFRLSSYKRTGALEYYQRKSQSNFEDLTGSNLSQFFMRKASTGKLYVKCRHMTYACCLSLEKSGFTTHGFFPFRNTAEPYNQAIQKGAGESILYICPQSQHF